MMEAALRRELDHIDRRLVSVEAVAVQSTAAALQSDALARDMADLKESVELVHDRITRRDREDAQRREAALKAEIAQAKVARAERKKDLRWTIATVLTAASIVIAAVALLINTGAPA